MINLELAKAIARALAFQGVREVCLCAGARNSPLILLFSEDPYFNKYHFFEERSAAFFALGRSRATGRPVAVITTSGTAVAELLPAVIEAHYTGDPLIVVSADRPRQFRGTGAPQTIEQVGIFGPYVGASLDFMRPEEVSLSEWKGRCPLQINVCFEEPLALRPLGREDFLNIDDGSGLGKKGGPNFDVQPFHDFLSNVYKPLVLVSALQVGAQAAVRKFLLQLGAPVYLEGTSGLREDPALADLRVGFPEKFVGFDSVIRIGGVPTTRLWRDLEEKFRHLPVFSISETPFQGMTRSQLLQCELPVFLNYIYLNKAFDRSVWDEAFTRDRARTARLSELLEREPQSEPGFFNRLSRVIEKRSLVYVGNSLPIREWDLAADSMSRGLEISANRGANGIDGQISTFLGMCETGRENWAILGDLTTLYDLAAPWIVQQMKDMKFRLVVMNNGGGRIFARIFQSPVFQNRHAIEFKAWAELWKLPYIRWEEVPASVEDLPDQVIIEARPDADATERFWTEWDRQ